MTDEEGRQLVVDVLHEACARGARGIAAITVFDQPLSKGHTGLFVGGSMSVQELTAMRDRLMNAINAKLKEMG